MDSGPGCSPSSAPLRPAPGGPAPPRPRRPLPRPSLRRWRRERAARAAAPLRNATGTRGRAAAGAPGRKRAGRAGAAADMCKMSFKVSAANSGRECRAGRQTCGGEPAPGVLLGRCRRLRGPQGGVSAAQAAGEGLEEATWLGWLLWFVVLVVWALPERLSVLRAAGRGVWPLGEGAAGTVARVTGGGGAGRSLAVSTSQRRRLRTDPGCGKDSRFCVLVSEGQWHHCRLLFGALFGREAENSAQSGAAVDYRTSVSKGVFS